MFSNINTLSGTNLIWLELTLSKHKATPLSPDIAVKAKFGSLYFVFLNHFIQVTLHLYKLCRWILQRISGPYLIIRVGSSAQFSDLCLVEYYACYLSDYRRV